MNAGDTLCVEFSIATPHNTPPDVLSLNLMLIQVNQAFTTRTAKLYDGATLLGTHSRNDFGTHVGALHLQPANSFASATSVWTFNNPAIVDFTPILNGTIQGRIEFSILTGQVDINLGVVNLTMIRGTNASGGAVVSPAPVITSISINQGGGCAPATVGTGFCFGDGSGTFCPCGNTGGPGEGCANSTGSGATLSAFGSNNAAANDLAFAAANLIPNQPALLFAGDNAVAGGNGVTFGDGLRCAGGNVRRLGVRVPNVNGDASWGPGFASPNWMAGDTRRFQVWYRNPAGGPCATTFNLTHGVEVVFN